MRSISSKAVLRCTCERIQRAAIENVADSAATVIMGNEYGESSDRQGAAILGCHTWLLAFQYQPAIHHLGTHLRGYQWARSFCCGLHTRVAIGLSRCSFCFWDRRGCIES